MTKKRILSLVLALALMLPAFAAVAGEIDLTPKSDKINIWYLNDEKANVLYDEFARLHPEYELNHDVETTIAGWDVVMASLATMAASGDCPDAIYIQLPSHIVYYSGYFQSLDQFIRNDPDFNIADLDVAVMDSNVQFNDAYWFMPDQFGACGLLYNRDMFEEAGLDPDAPPTTWSQFVEYARKLTKFDSNGTPVQLGYSGYSWNKGWPTFYEFLATSYGTFMVDPLGIEWTVNTDEIKSILNLGKELTAIYGGSEKWPEGVNFSVVNGNAAMQEYVLAWAASEAITSNVNFSVATMPVADGFEATYMASNGYVWAIPKGAKNPEGAWEWIKHYYTDGAYAYEKYTAEKNGLTWIPSYQLHLPTRAKINDLLMPLVDNERLLQVIDVTNQIYSQSGTRYAASGYEAEFADQYFWPNWRKIESGEVDMNSGLDELQSIADRLRDDWIARKTTEGWNFDVAEGMFPTPPQE